MIQHSGKRSRSLQPQQQLLGRGLDRRDSFGDVESLRKSVDTVERVGDRMGVGAPPVLLPGRCCPSGSRKRLDGGCGALSMPDQRTYVTGGPSDPPYLAARGKLVRTIDPMV